MNLQQMKQALEQSVKENLEKSLEQGTTVTANYDINGAMLVELKLERPKENNQSSILCYNINYNEQSKLINIVAFNRFYAWDSLGIAVVNNEPVAIAEDFIQGVKSIIAYSMDIVYNPDKSVADEDLPVAPAPMSEEEIIAPEIPEQK